MENLELVKKGDGLKWASPFVFKDIFSPGRLRMHDLKWSMGRRPRENGELEKLQERAQVVASPVVGLPYHSDMIL